jgi:pimeloyl-ACP methyl ester carboxylesterase
VKIRANGLSLSCEVDGADGAPVVVFIHGLAASGSVWKGQAERLRDRFRVVRYDLRAHGDSESLDEPCTRSDLATDLIGVVDALCIERAFLVGHSAGGVIAMQAAVEHPARVCGLVLVGTASECNDKTAAWYEQTAEKSRTEGGAAAVKAMGIRNSDAPVPEGRGFAHVTLAMRTLNADPLTERLRALSIPTLILVGDKDFLGVGGSVILSRAIAGSEIEIVEGRGHGLYIEDPDWFASRVSDFFDRVLVDTA